MSRKIMLLIGFTLIFFSCKEELEKITAPEVRSAEAVASLKAELVSPANGWVLNYQPTNESGVFYMLLDFNNDGTVRIQSDIPNDNGAYYDQVIPYRIDTRLSLELIFETYGAFHFLFEIDQSSFGAEFQFRYVETIGGNPTFVSKSDNPSSASSILFVPAASGAEDVFSRELAKNILEYDTISSLYLGIIQHLVLNDQNVSVFWGLDLEKRTLSARGAGVGLTTADMVTGETIVLDHETTIGYYDDKMVLNNPLVFSLGGKNYSISEVLLETAPTGTGAPLCGGGSNTPVMQGSIPSLGAVTIYKTLFDIGGMKKFAPYEKFPYSVNPLFISDSLGFPLSASSGSIGEHFPEANGFVFNYGYKDTTTINKKPEHAVGFSYVDDLDSVRVILRPFDVTTTVENRVSIVFSSDNYYYSSDKTSAFEVDSLNLKNITEQIFGLSGGEIHASSLKITNNEDLTVFSLYNACNNYEFLLVKPK